MKSLHLPFDVLGWQGFSFANQSIQKFSDMYSVSWCFFKGWFQAGFYY